MGKINKKAGISFKLLLLASLVYSQQGELTGVIKDTLLDTELEYAAISVENEMHYYTCISNEYGIYYIRPLPAGLYTVTVHYMNSKFVKSKVAIFEDEVTELNFKVSSAIDLPPMVILPDYNEDLINRFNPNPGGLFKEEDLEHTPSRVISDIVSEVPFVYVEDGKVQIKGARPEATKVIIDGTPTMSSQIEIPISSIRKLEVLSGAIPAKYGDAIGGLIVIETKGF